MIANAFSIQYIKQPDQSLCGRLLFLFPQNLGNLEVKKLPLCSIYVVSKTIRVLKYIFCHFVPVPLAKTVWMEQVISQFVVSKNFVQNFRHVFSVKHFYPR